MSQEGPKRPPDPPDSSSSGEWLEVDRNDRNGDSVPRFGVAGNDDVPDAAGLINPTDRLRAVYLLTSEFTEEEASTALTDPPHGRSNPADDGFLAQPVDRPILLRLDGVQAGEVVSLGVLPATIGRHPGCRIVVDDAGVSRQHATISAESDGKLFLEDLGSRNGTFIEGERIKRAELSDGCLVQIGLHVGYRFTLVDERQEQLLRQLYRSSTRDALTGVYNRRHFDDRLTSEVAYARRHSTDVSLIIVDIDFFKQVNDTYGHSVGDVVLRQVALTLQHQLRLEDVLSRVGGEEFAIILRGIANPGAARLGERLRAAVAESPIMAQGTAIPITISVGCAALSELEAATEQTLFSTADARLYAAKHQGRNRVVSA
jgi:diguanylate cyclase (GGDEF)-like protein